MTDEKTYTHSEMSGIMAAARERQETLEALECARITMVNTNQYPRFITRIDYIIRSIEGVVQQTPSEEKLDIGKETDLDNKNINQTINKKK